MNAFLILIRFKIAAMGSKVKYRKKLTKNEFLIRHCVNSFWLSDLDIDIQNVSRKKQWRCFLLFRAVKGKVKGILGSIWCSADWDPKFGVFAQYLKYYTHFTRIWHLNPWQPSWICKHICTELLPINETWSFNSKNQKWLYFISKGYKRKIKVILGSTWCRPRSMSYAFLSNISINISIYK